MCELPEFVLKILENIAHDEGYIDYSLDIKSGSKHGDGFVGIMSSILISGKRKVHENLIDDKLHLMCKLPPTNVNRRKEFLINRLFPREAYVYSRLLPAFVEFQKEKGLSESESFLSFPKYYAVVSNENTEEYVIIMEDLKIKGFTMWPKNRPVLLSQARLVVQELGKLHAISFALKDQRPEIFTEFKKLDYILRDFMESESWSNLMEPAFTRAIDALENGEHKRIVADVKKNFREIIRECIVYEDVCEPFGVISHCDCWNNNLLYQFNDGASIIVNVYSFSKKHAIHNK